ncbi:MAG: peroxiredoxin [Bacteroidales bacterium]|nr:peroxiredoxin [Bacteroidales bacterium]
MPMIGEYAPGFTAETTHGKITFPNDYQGRWVIFFSHPGAFTPVCTSEFMEMQDRISEFNMLNCELVGLSTDGLNSQYEWIKTVRDEIEFRGKKDIEIQFPIIADTRMEVAGKYGMIHEHISTEKTVRALFLIDPNGMIRASMYYPVSNGRNIDEILRLLKAIQTTDEYDVATPVDWKPGEDVFIPPPFAGGKASKQYSDAVEKGNCPAWFMCTRQIPDREK